MWYYGGVPMTVIEQSAEWEQTIAKLQPLQASTINQIFGWTKPQVTVNALIVGSSDMVALANLLINNGNAYTLSGLYDNQPVSIGSYYPEKLTYKLLHVYKQNFRSDRSPTDQVYEVTLTLAGATG